MHNREDQCAFVRANCPDEEAGLISYMQFYYCSLPNAKPLAFIILMIWLGLLFSTIGIAASDFLCINLSTIAGILGMSESLTGVTFLAFGNGSPDVFSTFAAMSTHSGSLAIGELIGAAGFITAVVAGSMALVRPFKVAKKSFVRDVGFFAVAVSFSMVFLADGSLHLWECVVMVAFYLFYVVFVVSWHWWFGRQREKKLREAVARSHHHIPLTQELRLEDVRDEEASLSAAETTSLLRDTSGDNLGLLEAGGTSPSKEDEPDEDDEARDRTLAELQSNMRLGRPSRGERRNTITPIRPSLAGAWQFRAVIDHLEKKSANTPPHFNMRSYFEAPATSLSHADGEHASSTSQQQGQAEARSGQSLQPHDDRHSRTRSVSANDAGGLRLDTNVLGALGPSLETALYVASPVASPPSQRRAQSLQATPDLPDPATSPRLVISPPASQQSSRAPSPAPPWSRSPDRLAPPTNFFHRPDYQEGHMDQSNSPASISPTMSPNLHVPTLILPPSYQKASPPSSPFPTYTDSPAVITPHHSRAPSIQLPSASMPRASTAEAYYTVEQYDEDVEELRTFKWWPYAYLPPPHVIMSTLFPTIYSWNDKRIWDKIFSLAMVPSVLVLTATVPAIESQTDDGLLNPDPGLLAPGGGRHSRTGTLVSLPPDSRMSSRRPSIASQLPHKAFLSRHDSEAPPPQVIATDDLLGPKEWNRWLVCFQIFTAPIFVDLVTWANFDDDHSLKLLLILILCSVVFSLVCLCIVLATTSPDHAPKYRPLLCFLGFVVGIAWISTIANEVVGVLKAFGVILGISDAILGLTIFAVGNSLGDLVADYTVAKLGYSVMALSACFGGPMLNILLGIGVSGVYMTLRHGRHWHAQHPGRPIKYKPYQIEVSTTLLISGITLLVTLLGLLIVVPLNGWWMDRKIGWGLITLWTLSSVANVVVEVLGYGGDLAITSG